ncbi:MAG: hypothetical protein ABIG20_00760 [archaeon]
MDKKLKYLIMFVENDTYIKNLMEATKHQFRYSEEQVAEMLRKRIKGQVDLLRGMTDIPNDVEKKLMGNIQRVYGEYHEELEKPENMSKLHKWYSTKKLDVQKEFGGPVHSSYSLAYIKKVSMLRSEFALSVVDNIFGCGIANEKGLAKLSDETYSFNELLHVIHKYGIVEYKGKITKKVDAGEALGYKRTINFYGEVDNVAKSIADALIESRIGYTWVEFITIEGYKHISLRDIGHATTVAIEYKGKHDPVIINWGIPKITDKFIAKLKEKGLSNSGKGCASGEFRTTLKELPEQVVDLLSRVPTDFDM